MTCDETAERLPAYLDGELNGVEADQVKRHIASCASCALELTRTRRLFSLLSEPIGRPLEASSDERFASLWQRVSAEERPALLREGRVVHGETGRRRPGRTSVGRHRVRVAAGALAATLALSFWWVAERGNLSSDARRGSDASVVRVAKSAPERAAPPAAPAQVAKVEEPRPKPPQVATSATDMGPVAQVAHPSAKAPRAVRRRPDMFLDYSIVRRLDELDNFEAIMAKGGADDRKS
jgi:anti-sigma factor RsiW